MHTQLDTPVFGGAEEEGGGCKGTKKHILKDWISYARVVRYPVESDLVQGKYLNGSNYDLETRGFQSRNGLCCCYDCGSDLARTWTADAPFTALLVPGSRVSEHLNEGYGPTEPVA